MDSDWGPWLLTVGAALAYDGLLIYGGRPSLSERAGRHPVHTLTVLAVLACHFTGRPQCFRRVDPFHHAVRLVPRRTCPATP